VELKVSDEDPLIYLTRKALKTFAKGQPIYDLQHPSGHLYVVILGRVKITHTADDGCQTITDILAVDKLFGESCLIGERLPAEAAVPLTEVSLMAWTREEIEQRIESEPRLGLALSQFMVRKCIRLKDRIENMALYKTPERVMLALLQLASGLGVATLEGAIRVPSLTHYMLAEYVGTSREIVTFQMNRLRKLGLLRYSRKHIDVYSQSILDDLHQHGVALPHALRGGSMCPRVQTAVRPIAPI
jgi:CRP/FNR family transcriptional regulator